MSARRPRPGSPGMSRGDYGTERTEKTERLAVPMDARMLARARASARGDGLSVAEWVRRCMRRAWGEAQQ